MTSWRFTRSRKRRSLVSRGHPEAFGESGVECVVEGAAIAVDEEAQRGREQRLGRDDGQVELEEEVDCGFRLVRRETRRVDVGGGGDGRRHLDAKVRGSDETGSFEEKAVEEQRGGVHVLLVGEVPLGGHRRVEDVGLSRGGRQTRSRRP